MKKPVFEGLATAIVTPFKNGTIDIPTFEMLLDTQLAANVDAIVVCGTTGESATLSAQEQLALIAHAIQYTAGRCKIIAGTGSNDTAHAIDMSRAASSMGACAVLVVTPYYNKCTQSGLIAHYTAIADAVSCPVICYNVPSRTGVDMTLETYQALSKHPNIQGVKEAGGSPAKIAKTIETCADDFFVWSGRGGRYNGTGREGLDVRSFQRPPEKNACNDPRVPAKRFPPRGRAAARTDGAHWRTVLRGKPDPGQKGAGAGGYPGRRSPPSADGFSGRKAAASESRACENAGRMIQ